MYLYYNYLENVFFYSKLETQLYLLEKHVVRNESQH